MSHAHDSHLNSDALVAFARGELDGSRFDVAEQHVLKCDECCEALRAIDISAAVELIGRSATAGQTLRDNQQSASNLEQQEFGQSHGRFLPGTVLNDRYRIVSLLGTGGMGEVYRADDLKLGQAVALKFVGKNIMRDPQALRQLHSEVRLARHIAHPNVCRVYDIGETDGQHFLSMEYIDGEDLRSLLKRIGRLPTDKGIEIARQISAGLRTAHQQGILHRDLKPANIMIDGRGYARIADFGLAQLTDARHSSVIAGTPAYMAPEQLLRGENSVQSDLYSLGLVLLEVFSGKPVFDTNDLTKLKDLHRQFSPKTLTDKLTHEIDADFLQSLNQCLACSPEQRPASVNSLLASMPGGDPLAATLASGQTPSPELLAATPLSSNGFNHAHAGICLAVLLVGIVMLLFVPIGRLDGSIHSADFPLEPAILAHKSREIVAASGYFPPQISPEFSFEAFGFIANGEYRWNNATGDQQEDSQQNVSGAIADATAAASNGVPLAERVAPREVLERPQSEYHFWYRLSQVPLVAERRLSTRVSFSDPPPFMPGMVQLRLDLQGRLVDYHANPIGMPKADGTRIDYRELFTRERIGMDFNEFEEVDFDWAPLTSYDAVTAWRQKGTTQATGMQIMAAEFRGQLVACRILWPHEVAGLRSQIKPIMDSTRVAIVLLLGIAVFLAPLNWRSGRCDRKGAFRIAATSLVLTMLGWLFGATHSGFLAFESQTFLSGLQGAVFVAVMMWCFYLALEPFVRRFWPLALVTWTRLLRGNLRDAELGRDLLVGTSAAIGCAAIWKCWHQLLELIGRPPQPFFGVDPDSILGPLQSLATVFDSVLFALTDGMFLLMFLFALRLPIKAKGIATVLFVGFFTLQFSLLSPDYFLMHLLFWGVAALLVTRFGLVALICFQFVRHIMEAYPIQADMTKWYAGYSLIPLLMVAAIGIYGYFSTVARESSYVT